MGKKANTVTLDAEKYDKKTQREHILLRPDTYIGYTELTNEEMWVYSDETNTIIKENITFSPGFLKIFDEIIVNARDASIVDNTCDCIKIEYNKDEGFISVYNNGDIGIPVEEHPVHKMLIPTMIFGELLTSSNFDDNVERVVGGRNGIGATCTNIYSTKFIVEIDDAKRNKRYKQIWTDNMLNIDEPIITKLPAKNKSSVKITFYPDFNRFGIIDLNNDHYKLFHRRVIDIAGTTHNKLKVFFNNVKIDVTNFKSYITMYYPDTEIFYDSTDRWDVGVIYKQDLGDSISFVNGVNTYKGGTHCNAVMDSIIKPLINDYIKKKNKEIKVTASTIKDNLVFFINSIIINPSFSSQTKDTLSTKPEKFGSKYEPSQALLKKLAKCGIVEQVIDIAKVKENSSLKKTDGKKQLRISGIPKLEDANKAGSKESNKCTLILTEGDSAKATAMAGLSIIGRDYYGIFPLKGKLLNVREASPSQLLANEEIKNLKIILGLKQGEDYSIEEKFNTLRYGHIMLMCDQDVDGSHIKGLFINMLHTLWPTLVKCKDFVQTLNTPIVKATKGKEVIAFYNLSNYEQWKETPESNGYKVKYYKGLGTSTPQEAREYFINIDEKLIKYFWDKEDDDEAIKLAFDKSKTDERKNWLMNYDKNNTLMYEQKEIQYYDFIHSDLIHFSNEDIIRSIPSVIDGLKPSQRKILYGAFLRGLDKDEVKVAQLAGFVSDRAAYHHGEMSLNGAIIGMAQNFPGSNNINILKPLGQFGCLSPDTKILLWNGSIKRADEIKINDELIGDDGTKRIVTNLTNGTDDMYEIKLSNDCIFIANSEHILTLCYPENNIIYWNDLNESWHLSYFNGIVIKEVICKSKNKETSFNEINEIQKNNYEKYKCDKIIDIKIIDYLKISNYDKSKFKMISNYTCIDWDKKDVPIDPYIFGNFLENGTDVELLDKYRINDKETRLQLLAGIIDTNGDIKLNNNINTIEISNYDNLIDWLNFICKSLGLNTQVKDKVLVISGNNLNTIPTKIKKIDNINHNDNLYDFTIKYLGKNKFNGWQVDKNERFLLGNFIITHNSRIKNGKDFASARYIWTMLEDLTSIIYNPHDTPVLNHQDDDGIPIEPEYYCPIIPMILVNGTEGIGTGFSTKIPPYNPLDIITNIRNLINNEKFIFMNPWWQGFKGTIKKIDDNNYEIYGNWTIDNNKLIITELPVGEATSNYKEFLEKLLEDIPLKGKPDDKKKKTVKKDNPFLSYKDNNTDTQVYFELTFEEGYLNSATDIEKSYHLCKKYSTTNMHLYSPEGHIKKYNTVEDIITDYYTVRLELYDKRKQYQLNILEYQLKLISYKVKFILMVIDKKIQVNNNKKHIIEEVLEENEFPKLGKNKDDDKISYDYLLSMPVYNFTFEKIEELKKQQSDKETEFNELNNKSSKNIWLDELDILEKKYKIWFNKLTESFTSHGNTSETKKKRTKKNS